MTTTTPAAPGGRIAPTGKIYQAIGHFFVEFSQLQWVMDRAIADTIGGSWTEVLTVLVELTADSQRKAWFSAITQACGLLPEDDEVLRALSTEIQGLIQLRNDWAHGHWFLGPADESTTDWPHAELERLKNTGQGVASSAKPHLKLTAAYIESAAEHVAFVTDAVRTFSVLAHYWRQDAGAQPQPGSRVRITGPKGKRQLELSRDGSAWDTAPLGKFRP